MSRNYPAVRATPDMTNVQRLQLHTEVNPDGCWIWQLTVRDDGYGLGRFDGRQRLVHRAAYEAFVGPIPDGLTIDHTCHTDACALGVDCPHRACCNPAHLEPATQRSNTLRGNSLSSVNLAKTHCPADHPYDEANTRLYRGGRYCKTCQRISSTARSRVRRAHRGVLAEAVSA